ncbi:MULTISPECIES: DUF6221 family protein [unclassified Streptomyces]|uniref:DUF6221 family protein n=1 Tax=unclassified Streptomyces TaxID=2593676 RepID=UPI002271ED50|nr:MULTISPECIES: DUF6221 family protein [unclassified Streptomyces]MCY0921854.1 DUF6221 family protein [Streptomyces sp. H27-G5]MCY0957196.1 DUF6221 family protein [Streptomyces sp. H27-H5]
MDLYTFLRDRLADDKTVAEAHQQWSPHWYYDHAACEIRDRDNHGTVAFVPGTRDGGHLARHDPARTLLDIDAKARVVELCAAPLVDVTGIADPQPVVVPGEGSPWAPDVLRLLALPYADHPDYDPTWAPAMGR